MHGRIRIRRFLQLMKHVLIILGAIFLLITIICIQLVRASSHRIPKRTHKDLVEGGVVSMCSPAFNRILPPASGERPLIIIITPTHARPTRLADMIRFAQTLMHIHDIVWLVIEDGDALSDPVYRIIRRTQRAYCYFGVKRNRALPLRGWTARDFALKFLRKRFAEFSNRAIVYFADDDNTYDIRLFDMFIRKVKTVGVWAVGIVAQRPVEAPRVNNDSVVDGWLTDYAPKREWAIDMAGFALNLNIILQRKNANFIDCKVSSPEPCLLSRLNLTKQDLQPFGHADYPRDILVWHTKSSHLIKKGLMKRSYGYLIE
ncbi:unnamed protein product [Toxocara canis]|uniref:Galactosylgalactosylxylosylprotein 3-beta-glucuronosyltransferase n=1 Tax=Toxocara canis TaxID=6265 RepID=A0A3P7GNF1_TOXCA|nr:unnamed protein product [Toxocara canis]